MSIQKVPVSAVMSIAKGAAEFSSDIIEEIAIGN
jgi:hypothetical protein